MASIAPDVLAPSFIRESFFEETPTAFAAVHKGSVLMAIEFDKINVGDEVHVAGGHDEAMSLIRRAHSVTILSYEEAIAVYLRARGILNDGEKVLGAPIPADWSPVRLSSHEAMKEALWQLLDDMGENGLCVCQAAKDQARAALKEAEGER
jgi:hypothetical protein